MAKVWRGRRVDGVCQRCFNSIYDNTGRCKPCGAINRRMKRTGMSWEEAAKFPFKEKTGYAEVPPEALTGKQRYLKSEKGKAYARKWAAYRRANLLNAALLQDDEWNKFVLDEIYALSARRELETGISWHVDHQIPLNGDDVCGFHVWYNLQLLPASLNILKGNSYE